MVAFVRNGPAGMVRRAFLTCVFGAIVGGSRIAYRRIRDPETATGLCQVPEGTVPSPLPSPSLTSPPIFSSSSNVSSKGPFSGQPLPTPVSSVLARHRLKHLSPWRIYLHFSVINRLLRLDSPRGPSAVSAGTVPASAGHLPRVQPRAWAAGTPQLPPG